VNWISRISKHVDFASASLQTLGFRSALQKKTKNTSGNQDRIIYTFTNFNSRAALAIVIDIACLL
jgi:hypothetical protein